MAYQWRVIEDVEVRRMLQRDENKLQEIRLGNRRICLARKNEKIWAFDAKCPHQGGPLARGFINEACQVVCPWHRFAFDLETGQSDSGGYFIRTYELKIKGKEVWIKLPKRKFLGLF